VCDQKKVPPALGPSAALLQTSSGVAVLRLRL
jgi:hypothetical protein